jgi:hypothetical protein
MKRQQNMADIAMPWFGPEPKFKPEPFRTKPKSGPKFGVGQELDHKSSSRFK